MFTLVVHKHDWIPRLVGLCAGYESKEWRYNRFIDFIFESLPDFALPYSEYSQINYANSIAQTRKAAANVYRTDKYSKRGEFGELLLHVVLKQVYGTIPAVSKLYYKDGPNDTVKGFDSVHVIPTEEGLDLWLGEVKFYKNGRAAMSDVVKEIDLHLKTDYLKSEFVAITNKIDPEWPHAEQLNLLLHADTSLDKVFERLCIPVLITYDSKTVNSYTAASEEYYTTLAEEINKEHEYFSKLLGEVSVEIHLFLVPLKSKKELQKRLDQKLKSWQNL